MPKGGFQLTVAATQMYEEQKVPAMFGPLAHATLARHEVGSDDVVLDVACGTGIVARTIRDRFGRQPSLTGIDLHEAMIETARDICDRESLEIDLQVCDATATAFDDGKFTFLICQQGLQYFPDEDAALAELRRVAADRARFVFTVWSRPSPLIVALADSLSIHAGEDLAKRALAPFSWAGAETIVDRMSAARYIHINLEELEVNRVLSDPEQSIPKEIMSTPVGLSVAALGKAVFDKVVAEMLDATRRYRHDDQLVIAQHTHVITAMAG